jgi:tRNA nucleotidyltransferase (CCA-adding enzyme)
VNIYQVGGSVRDALLGLPVKDRDFVVVGATPDEMLAAGFKPVGRDFPVFLHRDTHEEYALARTERKSGRGHQGFVFHAAPDVTLEEDLARRDLTINAMARGADGALIDPYGGLRDLEARVLRHVSPAFAEDPLRVLRVARFAARFGFAVADETLAMMRGIVERGELRELSSERVWQELARGLVTTQPSRMLSILRTCGALREVAPEVDHLYGAPAAGDQPDVGIATATALDCGARREAPLVVQYATLCRHLSPADADALSARLRPGTECRDAGGHASRHAATLERAAELSPEEWLRLLLDIDALRRGERLRALHGVVAAYACASPGNREQAARIERLASGAREALSAIDHSALNPAAGDMAGQVRERRLAALAAYLEHATGAG